MLFLITPPASGRRSRSCRRQMVAAELLETRSLLSAVVVQLSAMQDNTIYHVHTADQANGQGEFIVTGGASGAASARRGLISFDVASANIPSGATILDVVLTMNLGISSGGATRVSLQKALRNWGEGFSRGSGNEIAAGGQAGAVDPTWLFARYHGIPWKTPGGDFAGVSASITVSTKGTYEWSGSGLIADVQSWLDNPMTNFGWFVNSAEAAGNIKAFLSRSSQNAALRPSLEITYENPVIPAIVEGRKWHDKNANGIRDTDALIGLNLRFGQGRYFNNFGGQEYWYQSVTDQQWYFLRQNGALVRWNGKAGTLAGTLVERFDPRVWHNPESLLGSATRSDEPWMNGFVFELLDARGQVVATTTSMDMDRNGDGFIDEETERGWYRFEITVPGRYSVREVVPDGWMQSASRNSEGAAEAWQLKRTLGLQSSKEMHQNFGGRNEKWIRGADGWYYVTPAGDLYQWDGRGITEQMPLNGTLIATPGMSYYYDASLLHDARSPMLNVQESKVITGWDFGNFQPLVISGRSILSQIPAWLKNSSVFQTTAVPVGQVNTSNPIYIWNIVVIDPFAATPENIGGVPGGAGDDPLFANLAPPPNRTPGQRYQAPGGSTTFFGSQLNQAPSGKFNFDALAAANLRIIDAFYSSLMEI